MQPKKPRFNPLILALALAAVLMVWSVLGGGSSSGGSSSMVYSTAVQYFENLQVTKFTLDLNTGVLTMTLKEGKLALPDPSSVSTVQSTGGLLSGMLSSSSSGSTGAEKNSDGTVTVRYKLPYASMFVKNVDSYIAAYDEANPDAPMEYDYTPLKESIPWMEILFYLAMLGCTGFLLFSMMRGGGAGGGIMNVGKARVKDERENKKTATFADVAGEDVQARYVAFQRVLFDTLENYSEPIPGVVDTVEALRKAGIKIGSTTGYTDKMMDIVIPAAEKAGYKVDNCVTSDHLPAGRPYPYMVYRNMIDLAVPSVDCVLKYGDTIADIKEGVNAKVWTVGVVMGSNELALTQEEVAAMPAGELDARKAEVRRRMLEAGAHYVVDDITELPAIIETINQKMNQ